MNDYEADRAFLVARLRETFAPLKERLRTPPAAVAPVEQGAYSDLFQASAMRCDHAMGGIEIHIALVLGGQGDFESLEDATQYLTHNLEREANVLIDQRNELARCSPPTPLYDFHLLWIEGLNEAIQFILDLPNALEAAQQGDVIELTVPSGKLTQARQRLQGSLGYAPTFPGGTPGGSSTGIDYTTMIVAVILLVLMVGSTCLL